MKYPRPSGLFLAFILEFEKATSSFRHFTKSIPPRVKRALVNPKPQSEREKRLSIESAVFGEEIHPSGIIAFRGGIIGGVGIS